MMEYSIPIWDTWFVFRRQINNLMSGHTNHWSYYDIYGPLLSHNAYLASEWSHPDDSRTEFNSTAFRMQHIVFDNEVDMIQFQLMFG